MTDRIERVRQILAFEFGWSRSTPIADSEQHAETITQQIRALYKPRGGVMDELLLTDEEIKPTKCHVTRIKGNAHLTLKTHITLVVLSVSCVDTE